MTIPKYMLFLDTLMVIQPDVFFGSARVHWDSELFISDITYKVVPPKLCVLIYNPMNCRYITNKNHSEIGVINQLNAMERGHHLVPWNTEPRRSRRTQDIIESGWPAPQEGATVYPPLKSGFSHSLHIVSHDFTMSFPHQNQKFPWEFPAGFPMESTSFPALFNGISQPSRPFFGILARIGDQLRCTTATGTPTACMHHSVDNIHQ